MDNNIEGRIKNVMSTVLDIPAEGIHDSISPDMVETWDSMKQLTLMIALEEEFECRFTDEQSMELLNYKLIVEVVKEVLAG